MEERKGAQVDLSIPGKTSLTMTAAGTVLATVTNSLFTLAGDKVEMANWACDLEALAGAGKTVYVGDVDGTVWEWAENTKKELFRQEFAVQDLDAVGGVIATATEDPHPLLYRTGKVEKLEPPHKGPVMSVSLSKGAVYLASIGYDGRMGIYDLQSGSRITRFQICKRQHDDCEEKLKAGWSPDGTTLLVPGQAILRTVRSPDWQLLDSTLAATAPIIALKWVDMDTAAGYSKDGMVFVWDVVHFRKVAEMQTEKHISDLLVTEKDIVYASYEGIVYFWKNSQQSGLKANGAQEEALKAEEKDEESEKSEEEDSEPINYFDSCIGVLPQKALPAFEEDEEDKVLHRSLLGTIVAKQQEAVPIIEIQLELEKNSRLLTFRDSHEFSLANMSESGALLAGKGHFLLFKSFAKDTVWLQELEAEETIESVVVAETWCASYSSDLMLRVFSVHGGVQLCALSVASPVLTMASYEDLLGSVHLQGLPRLGVQSLSMEIRSLGSLANEASAAFAHVELPISPEEELVWFGFSTSGVPCTADSAGITRIYWQSAGLWVPILNAPDFKVIGVSDGDVYGIEEGEVVAKPYEAQFCSTPSSKNEANYFIQRLKSEVDSSSSETDIEMEKSVINMIREAAVSGQEEKVLAYFGLARKRKTKEIAIRLLMQMQMYDLAQRLSDRLVNNSKSAVSAPKIHPIPTNTPEIAPKPLSEKSQIVEVAPSNPFQKKSEAKADIFSSLSEVTKRKADPLPPASKKKRL